MFHCVATTTWELLERESRDESCMRAAKRVAEVQEQNRREYNKKRKEAQPYREGDLMAVKRTQRTPGLKLVSKFLGSYEVVKVLRNDHYLVHKVGQHEGPQQTSTTADFMKPWLTEDSDFEIGKEDDDSEDVEREDIRGRMSLQDGRV